MEIAEIRKVSNFEIKVLDRIGKSRTNNEYIAGTLTNDLDHDDIVRISSDDQDCDNMSLPPRYRFRDLLLGDFAFNDDGER